MENTQKMRDHEQLFRDILDQKEGLEISRVNGTRDYDFNDIDQIELMTVGYSLVNIFINIEKMSFRKIIEHFDGFLANHPELQDKEIIVVLDTRTPGNEELYILVSNEEGKA